MKKRILSLVLAVAMCMGLAVPAFASVATTPSESAYEKYAEEALPRYLIISDLNHGENFTMTQPIPIYNGSDECSRAVFCFRDNVCIAEMVITFSNSSFASSFTQADFPAVTKAAIERSPLALVSSNNALFLITATATEVVVGQEDSASVEMSSKPARHYQMQEVNLTEISFATIESAVQPQSSNGRILDVPYVKNEYYLVNKNGKVEKEWICWAAAAASIIKYRSAEATFNGENAETLTAMDVFNRVKNNYPNAGTPTGNRDWMRYTFDTYFPGNWTLNPSGANFDTVLSIIENEGKPISCWIEDGFHAHFVVISGLTYGYGYYYYALIDSNSIYDLGTDKRILVQVSSSPSVTSFTYPAANGVTYNKWNSYIY